MAVTKGRVVQDALATLRRVQDAARSSLLSSRVDGEAERSGPIIGDAPLRPLRKCRRDAVTANTVLLGPAKRITSPTASVVRNSGVPKLTMNRKQVSYACFPGEHDRQPAQSSLRHGLMVVHRYPEWCCVQGRWRAVGRYT